MSNFNDAIHAIDEKIQHHSGEAKRHEAEAENLQRLRVNNLKAQEIQEQTVESLRQARKVLVEAERTSANDTTLLGGPDGDPVIL